MGMALPNATHDFKPHASVLRPCSITMERYRRRVDVLARIVGVVRSMAALQDAHVEVIVLFGRLDLAQTLIREGWAQLGGSSTTLRWGSRTSAMCRQTRPAEESHTVISDILGYAGY